MTSMPDPITPRQTHPGTEQVILGVDTHKDTHTAAIITTLGGLVGTRQFPTTAQGYRQLLDWARGHGQLRRAGVECTGSYGAGLARLLQAEGIVVIEVNQPDKAHRRRRGKTDALDAQAAAAAVLSGRASATAKTGDGPVEMLRLFTLAKDSATTTRTRVINQLHAVLITTDPLLRDRLRALSTVKLVRACTHLQVATPDTTSSAAAYTLRVLAGHITQLTEEIKDLTSQITRVITSHAPHLLKTYGVGPDSAAALLITAGDNPDRLHSEGSFAAVCGVSPIEMSSGKTQRHRLNRGGDRQANSALYTIVLTRLRWQTTTRDYLDRRITEGKTRKEAIRCLKRYIAREIYALIKPRPAPTDQALAA